MKYKILTDSACDLPQKILDTIDIIPVSLIVDGKSYRDTIDFTKKKFYNLLENSKTIPGSAAPSPYDYLSKINNSDENVFVFTISSSLSSSYNNALMAKEQISKQISEKTDKIIHVFDSLNASIGQGLIILKLKELLEANLPHQQIIEQIEKHIKNTKTFFILENMDNLINSGRINRIMGKLVSALNIKLILGKTDKGEIELYDKARGSKRTFNKLLKIMEKYESRFEDKVLGIAHYNCLEKATKFKYVVMERFPFKDIIITQIGPTIATYADKGGIIISF